MPRTEAEVTAAAADRGIVIPPACMPGVVANLALLARHAAILSGAAR